MWSSFKVLENYSFRNEFKYSMIVMLFNLTKIKLKHFDKFFSGIIEINTLKTLINFRELIHFPNKCLETLITSESKNMYANIAWHLFSAKFWYNYNALS